MFRVGSREANDRRSIPAKQGVVPQKRASRLRQQVHPNVSIDSARYRSRGAAIAGPGRWRLSRSDPMSKGHTCLPLIRQSCSEGGENDRYLFQTSTRHVSFMQSRVANAGTHAWTQRDVS